MTKTLSSLTSALPGELRSGLHNDFNVMVTKLDQVRDLSVHTVEALTSIATALPVGLHESLREDIRMITNQIEAARTVSAHTNETILSLATALPSELRRHLRDDLHGMTTQIEAARDLSVHTQHALASLAADIPAAVHKNLHIDLETLANQIKDARQDTVQKVSSLDDQFEEKLGRFSKVIAEQHQTSLERAEFAVLQNRGDAAALNQKINTMQKSVEAIQIPEQISLPPEFMKEMHDHWFRMTAQIEGSTETLHTKLSAIDQTVNQNRALVLEHVQSVSARTLDAIGALNEKVGALQASVQTIQIPEHFQLSPATVKHMEGHWHQMAAQIEASRASLDKLISGDVVTKLCSFADILTSTQYAIESQRAELAKPQTLAQDPLETLHKQWSDQWYHMAGQIEASRASLVETIAQEISKMESKLLGQTPDALSKSAHEYATQRQIEQQTHILGELVATLGILDSHMQQIKVEMHATGR